MDDSGEGRPAERDAVDERGTWFAQQIGDGWTEVEPGIYRFNEGVMNQAGIRVTPSADAPLEDDLIEALQPTEAEPDPPPRRRLGRRTRR
jgi:hypothetical protein